MDFALNPDQRMIRDTAAAFLADASTSNAVRTAMASPLGYDEKLWRQLAQELGWCATAIPENYDGLGLGCVELTLLLEQCGRFLLCAPFFATSCMATPVLLESGNAEVCRSYLPRIAAGQLIASVAWSGTGINWQPELISAVATPDGADYLLSGDYRHVPDATSAQLLLLPARLSGGELGLFAVPGNAAGLHATPYNTFDQTRRIGSIRMDQTRVHATALLAQGTVLDQAMQRAAALAAIALAAEQLGGAQACLDMTLAYTEERKQFGRTIASFQAVKHRCAEMSVRIEATRSAVHGAARVAAADPETRTLTLEAACVKTLASDTYFFCAQEAIQLHGGVGFTWEYDPQLHFKRAQADSHWLGDSDEMRERVASHLLGPI